MLPLSPSTGMLELMLVLVAGVSFELWLARRVASRPMLTRLWLGLGAPLLRSAMIVGAVLVAYPALFGFRAAPTLATLMHEGAARGGLWLIALCAARLLVPLPLSSSRTGLVDALQGVGAAALLFVGFSRHVGALSASPWPGALGAMALFGLCWLLPALAAGLGHDMGARFDARRGTRGLDQWLGQAMGMVAVAPVVMLYGYLLGTQLAM
ncbi:MAG: hypothetical protein IPG43_20295 [Proteobacteria bacterium]|nr:hypothetical protein [Pseudomonadota bacterium]